MSIYNKLEELKRNHKAGYFVLIDPDKHNNTTIVEAVQASEAGGADAILVGGSLMMDCYFEEKVKLIKKNAGIPVIGFPGAPSQVVVDMDATLFISIISGRNADTLIGEQVKAAPRLKGMGMETISTAYMLVESGRTTSVEFMSNTRPLPCDKPGIAAAHAIAAEMMGFKMIYLEAGSGALNPVSNEIIAAVKKYVSIPVIVGGGIRSPKTAAEKVAAGADFIVTGNVLEKEGVHLAASFAEAIHKC